MNIKAKLEGFWWSEDEAWFPMPQPYVGPWIDKDLFLKMLAAMEQRAVRETYRGWSSCRLCGCRNGHITFMHEGWHWPSGYSHYVEAHNVRPSIEFERFIMGALYSDPTRYREWRRVNVLEPRLQKIRDDARNAAD